MKHYLCIAGLALGLLAAIAKAENGAADRLLTRLEPISQLQGRFDQRQYADDGRLLGESSGSFRLLRPVYFSWEIESPDRQIIVANAQYLWHYDIDLQTVTRRPVAASVQASPLQVLAGDESVLREQFRVEQQDADRFVLVPLAGEHSFNRLEVSFAGNTIGGMTIEDKLNQRIEVAFSDLDGDTVLTPEDFDFSPPTGGDVDLFYYDE
jgi:outer membrane lipoprotein carrier protein